MENYISFDLIRTKREEMKLTQKDLANMINVSEKTISKWENKKGMPDISILPNLAKALGLSVSELISGKCETNNNKSANLLKANFYVCPICGNVINSVGEASIHCCGVKLIKEEAEMIKGICDITKDEIIVSIYSKMIKGDYISFISYVTNDKINIVKLYPEQEATTTFIKMGHGLIYYYDILNGLFCEKV